MSVIIGITYNEWRNPVNEHAQVELALIQLIRQTSRTQPADGVFFYVSTVRSDTGVTSFLSNSGVAKVHYDKGRVRTKAAVRAKAADATRLWSYRLKARVWSNLEVLWIKQQSGSLLRKPHVSV